VDAFFRGPNPPDSAIVIRANYCDNPFFPAELEEERLYDQRIYPARYGHIWEGEYEPQAVGALWDRLTIHENRRAEAPPLTRILVGIDPPVSAEVGSDECGIIVCAVGEDGRGYVLEDTSMAAAQPEAWAKRAIACYDHFEADAIVAEVNQGGEMVRAVIQAERKGVPVIQVRATRGKHVRAEPISALYKLGKISHVGAFPQLESQLCLFTAAGYEGEGSPDRADAMVWCFTELFPKLTRRTNDKAKRPQANRAYSPHRWRA
jgi:phage terminase large subunit-like protein